MHRQPDDLDDMPLPEEQPGLEPIRVPVATMAEADKPTIDELIDAELDLDIRWAMRMSREYGDGDSVYKALALQQVRNAKTVRVTP